MAVAFHLNKHLVNNNLNESLRSTYNSGQAVKQPWFGWKIIL